jgi:F-type H+-transporting ATPase subunit a
MKKRYLVYLLLLLMIVFGCGLLGPTQPVLPVIQLPGEIVVTWEELTGQPDFLGGFFGEGLTNTFIATIITYIVLIVAVLSLRARSRTADEVPTGFYNVVEMLIEGAFGYVQNMSGRFARSFFPFFMTFILLILTANWLELIPGVDSIGVKEDLTHHRVEVAEAEAEAAGEPALTEAQIHAIEEDAAADGGRFEGPFLVRAEEGQAGQTIVPFVRVPATDLNFTVALALVSVIFTEYFGLRALGAGYLKKFFNFNPEKIAKNPLGAIDPVVGILELISEISRILSFAFRLFGNIFAGQVLLFVIGFLLPVALVAVYGLEFFVGVIQAAVFGLLTLTFMAAAVTSHHDEEH